MGNCGNIGDSSADKRNHDRGGIASLRCVDLTRQAATAGTAASTRCASLGASWTLPFLGKLEYLPELKLWLRRPALGCC
jgi:hypothetical protein